MRPLYLASATAPATRRDQILHAAKAGFDGVGLRCDREPPSASEVKELQRVLADTGLSVLDIEVIRVGTEQTGITSALFDVAAALGARSILTVSDSLDRSQTVNRLGELAELAAKSGLTIALEFMSFTSVKTLDDAIGVVAEVGRPEIRLLPDVLHVVRSGSTMDMLSTVRHLIDYVQLCDAPSKSPGDIEQLIHEARYERLMPGAGQLDLASFLRNVPLSPVSVEVQSSFLQKTITPLEIAHLAYRSTREILEQLDNPEVRNA
jgi:sugar phosphate isomerase/epimerase